MKKETGLTLLNLMVALAIMAVAITMAAPNLAQLLAQNRFEAAANDFVISLSLARSEAIKRHQDVTLCPSADGATCSVGNWQMGWIISDAAGNLIRVHPELNSGISIAGAAGTGYTSAITYELTGRIKTPGSLVLCYVAGSGNMNLVAGRTVVINLTGRPKMDKNATNKGVLTTPFTKCDGT